MLKENAEYVYLQINKEICASKFPASFITPVLKQGPRYQKDNHRPISILPIISKIFEKLICRQISNPFENILSKI